MSKSLDKQLNPTSGWDHALWTVRGLWVGIVVIVALLTFPVWFPIVVMHDIGCPSGKEWMNGKGGPYDF